MKKSIPTIVNEDMFNPDWHPCECGSICLPHSVYPDHMYNDKLIRIRYHCVKCGYQPALSVWIKSSNTMEFIEELERIGFNREWQK